MAARFPALGDMFPAWAHDVLTANDRANLGPYRILHFVIVALFATRLIPKRWPGLNSPVLTPLIVCGEQALPVFCVGVFLSFAGHLVLVTGSGSVVQQLMVSLLGIVIMTLVAGYVSWSKRQDGQSLAPLGGHPSLGIR